jgi:hypothetical protein
MHTLAHTGIAQGPIPTCPTPPAAAFSMPHIRPSTPEACRNRHIARKDNAVMPCLIADPLHLVQSPMPEPCRPICPEARTQNEAVAGANCAAAGPVLQACGSCVPLCPSRAVHVFAAPAAQQRRRGMCCGWRGWHALRAARCASYVVAGRQVGRRIRDGCACALHSVDPFERAARLGHCKARRPPP